MSDVLAGWLPIQIGGFGAVAQVDWMRLGTERLNEPTFAAAVDRAIERPFNQLFRQVTPIETLRERSISHPGIAPSGFIFHVSRCGSTLVSQVLASLDDAVVIAEAPAIESILRDPALSRVNRIARLQWLMAALGQPRTGAERRFFVKFESWHVADFPVVRAAFPDVPCIIVYRDPIEVLVSQLKARAPYLVPGVLTPDVFGMTASETLMLSADQYVGRTLGFIYARALRAADDPLVKLIAYPELPEAIADAILPHFGSIPSDADRAAFAARSRYDAKRPGVRFFYDSDEKQRNATPALRAIVERDIAAAYAGLEARRCA